MDLLKKMLGLFVMLKVGSMYKVIGDFDCNKNKLTSLAGAPKTVAGYFDCKDNNLT